MADRLRLSVDLRHDCSPCQVYFAARVMLSEMSAFVSCAVSVSIDTR